MQGAIAAALLVGAVGAGAALSTGQAHGSADLADLATTRTPIKHVVVIFGENVSFDHYFGTYPRAANTDGVEFDAAPDTPSINGLTPELMDNNPNGANPVRLGPDEAITCDQGHGYGAEQRAYDGGRVDAFLANTSAHCNTRDGHDQVMGYYDGNTVTALWNYAQHYSLNDNSFGTTYGPSTVGALNLVSGQTADALPADVASGTAHGTVYGDPDPRYDDCSVGVISVTGKNVGDLLNDRGITWGWFNGGFRSTANVLTGNRAACAQRATNIGGTSQQSYVPHHEPFQYYASTSNASHLPPSSDDKIGQSDRANHQYDTEDFDTALANGILPSVSFLKAPGYQDAHPVYSDPIDEQHFIVDTVNAIEQSPDWDSTAIIIAYDDSDGWYDHVMPPTVRGSHTDKDFLDGPMACGDRPETDADPVRCGFGPRLPLMVISPWAQQNHVDSTLTDQSSVLRFIEENWDVGEIGDGSSDREAGRLDGMFDFDPTHRRAPKVLLGKNGTVRSIVEPGDSPGGSGTVTVTTPAETITRTIVTPGDSVTTPGQTVTTAGSTVTTPAATVTTPGQTVTVQTPATRTSGHVTTVARAGRNGVSLQIRAPADAAATGSVQATAKVGSGRRAKTVTVGSARFTLGAGASKTVQLALNAAGRRELARAGHLRVTLVVTATPEGGSAARTRGTVTLKAAGKASRAATKNTRTASRARSGS